jgi:hypothetical protein
MIMQDVELFYMALAVAATPLAALTYFLFMCSRVNDNPETEKSSVGCEIS